MYKATIKSSQIVNKQIEFELHWFGTNPGDRIEGLIKSYISRHIERGGEKLNFLTSISGYLIYIYWNKSLNYGVTFIINYAETYTEEIFQWVVKVSDFGFLDKNETVDTLNSKYIDEGSFLLAEISNELIFDIDWLASSLEGKEIEVKIASKEHFIHVLYQFITIFRWTYFFLELGKIYSDHFTLNFQKATIDSEIIYEDYYLMLIGEQDNLFNDLLHKLLIMLTKIPYSKQLSIFREYFDLCYKVTDETLEITERMELIKENYSKLSKLDVEFTHNYLKNLINSVAQLEPEYNTVETLLTISDILVEHEVGDFAKVIEGTTLEVALLLQPKDKMKSLIILTKRIMQWGENYLIGYINSISSILASTEAEKTVLKEIIDLVTDKLKNSWEGLICLVETSTMIGAYNKALSLRLMATDLIHDPIAKAEDIFSAAKSALELKEIKDEEMITNLAPYLNYAIAHLPPGDIFTHHIKELLTKAAHYKRGIFINELLNIIGKNIDKIPFESRLTILYEFDEILSSIEVLSKLKIKNNLLLFDQYLKKYKITKDHSLLTNADSLLRQIFNNFDPTVKDFKQKLYLITRSIIFSAVAGGVWELIEDAINRFTSMVRDEKFAHKSIIEFYIAAGEERTKADDIDENDIGLRIYDTLIAMYGSNDSYKISIEKTLEYLPSGKILAAKAGASKHFYIYSLLEIKLARILNKSWIKIMVQNAHRMIDIGEFNLTRKMFEEILKENISSEDEYELLIEELKLAEYEFDLLSAEDALSKRLRVIQLAEENPSISTTKDIIKQYQAGIIDLISKGKVKDLHNFLINAIKYALNKQLPELIDFEKTLYDSYLSTLNTFSKIKSYEIYTLAVNIFDPLFTIYKEHNFEYIYKFVISLLQVLTQLYLNQTNQIKDNLIGDNEKKLIFQKIEGSRYQILLIIRYLGILFTENSVSNTISSEIQSNILTQFNQIVSAFNLRKNQQLVLELLNSSCNFLVSINSIGTLINLLDLEINMIKKVIADKSILSNSLMFGFLVINTVYSSLLENNFKYIKTILNDKIDKLINLALSYQIDEYHTQLLHDLRQLYLEDFELGIKFFNEECAEFLEYTDISMSQ